jgi:LysR family cys regulon transcriptional activator
MYPKVHLALRQGNPQQIAQMVVNGEADIGIATEGLDRYNEIVTFPGYSWHHTVVVRREHPLAAKQVVTLEDIAEYPIITYDQDFTGRSHIDQAFARAGGVPDVVLTAIDADVIKTYVELGMGVGIVAAMAYDAKRDTELVSLDTQHLFEPNTTRVGLRKGAFLRAYAYRLIEMFAPHLTEADVSGQLREAA